MKKTTDAVTVSTAAQILQRPESTVRHWARRGLLQTERLPSGLHLYSRRDCERLARERVALGGTPA